MQYYGTRLSENISRREPEGYLICLNFRWPAPAPRNICRTVLYHPDVGTANLHQCGHGKITVSAVSDLTSHTMTADGYVVVNKMKATSGTINLEIPQNSVGDVFLRRWAKWQKNSQDPARVALGTLTVQDAAGGFSIVCTGVTLQKVPDRVFDRTATNLVYTLLAANIAEQ